MNKHINLYSLNKSASYLFNTINKGNINGLIINFTDCIIPIKNLAKYANPFFDAAVFGWTAGEIYDDWSENKEGK